VIHRVTIIFSLLISLFEGCSLLPLSREPEDFIKVRGARFYHNEKPYYFAGTNMWYGCYLGSPGDTGDRSRLTRELDSLCALGLTNLRVLAASEDSYLKRSIRPAIQRAPGDLNDSLLKGLDYLLAEMGKRRMRAVLFLNNYWQWSGGMAAYNVWADGGRGADPDDPAEGYPAFMAFSAKFYTNPKADSLFREYVKRIVMRKNTCNGRYYSEDPTIMAWQLANEPRPGRGGEQDLIPFYRWIDQTGEYIHSLDTNHLVSTGNEGTVTTGWVDEPYLKAHESKFVDYLTCHIWPRNWGWFDPKRIDETLPSSEEKSMQYFQGHVTMARRLNKPIVLEEFGLARDSAFCRPESPTTARDRYLEKILGAIYDSARAGAPIAGCNVWTWGGEGRAMHADYVWREGDPFLGDPPQEPQGYNSIFITDTSTVRLLRHHAFKMMRLGTVDSLDSGGTR
jgi:mannan endo-1,4-beta-mannosidase